jgi:hypothetical protein
VTALPDLMRRLDRKLDIQRGLHLSYDDLAMLVASGAYAALKQAAEDEARAGDLPRLQRGVKCRNDPFIYFIRAGEAGPIKIGLTRSVPDRLAGLQICTADTLTVLASVQAPKEGERQLHAHFTPERIRGEWFRPSPRLMAYIGLLQ